MAHHTKEQLRNKALLLNKLMQSPFSFTEPPKNTTHYYIKLSLCILLYLIFIIMQFTFTHLSGFHSNNITYNIYCALLAQAEVLLSVCLTLFVYKTGYCIAVVLNIINLLPAIFAILHGITTPIPSFAVTIGTLIIISIIHKMLQKIQSNFEELMSQREELMALYEEVSASEETLSDQNTQLTMYNNLLREKETELNALAFYDALTNLPNRKHLIDFLTQLTSQTDPHLAAFDVVFVDLNNFKKINDALGHHIGDCILKEITERWQKLVKPNDLLGRLGGDEFALIITHPTSEVDTLNYVNSFSSHLTPPFYYKNKALHITASFGISHFPTDGKTAEQLLKCADTAMYDAKEILNGGISFFNQTMQEKVIKKLELENQLKQAVSNDELFLVYQPQFTAQSKELRGFEVLVRWDSPVLGFVNPAHFIPTAEETGDIISIGEWIFKTACLTFLPLLEQFETPPLLSINFSVVQLNEPAFIDRVKAVLKETGFNPKYLEFEVTESVFIHSAEHATKILDELHNLGIRIALDDFGTGYSSLSYLQQLPFDTLKIDKCFVDHIATHSKEASTVSLLIDLSHRLGLEVIAEGVEDSMQLDFLKNQHCDFIQGYYWGKPLALKQVISTFTSIPNPEEVI